MKKIKDNMLRKSKWILLYLIITYPFGCSQEDLINDNSAKSKVESFRRIKNTPHVKTYTEDLSVIRRGRHVGEAKGKVVIKFPEWGITEIYSFKVISNNGIVKGYFEVEDFNDETGEGFDRSWGIITCVTFEDDCRTARLGGEITGGVNHPDGQLPENHFVLFTVVDNPDGSDEATDLRSGQPNGTQDYHCSVGIPVTDNDFWWGTFREVEGKIKVKSNNCENKPGCKD